MSKQVRYLYEFGPFRIDTANRLLLRDGEPIPLKPKVVDTLFVLIENSGRVMEKDELIEKLWPDSYVEEGNLTQNIYELRKVLDDSSERDSYIETIPRRGYRFAVQVNKRPYEEGANLVKSDELTAPRADRADVDLPEPATREKALVTPDVAKGGARVSKRSALIFSVVLAGILIGALYYLSSNRSRPVVNEIKSLAILPFKSLNPEAADEYMGQGMADALITKLSNSNQIAVRPTSAVLRYSALDNDPLVAGRELSVDAVLDGKVQQLGDRVRVTVQLLRVADGSALWAEKFDARLTDIFAVQDSISDQAAHSLTLRLTGDERELMRKHYTQNFEAYQAYLQGRYFWNKRNAGALKTAVEHFERAIKIDPNYALAYAGLADCFIRLNESGVPMAEASVPRAKAAVLKALEIDDRLPEAHATLGFIKFRHDWDFVGAEQEFQRSLQLDANYSEAHQWYAFYLLAVGQRDKADAEMKRAQSLDPLSISFNANFGLYLFFIGQFDQSVQQCRKTLEMEPNSILARTALGLSYEQQRLYTEAIQEFRKAREMSPDDAAMLAALGHGLAKAGSTKEARELLQTLEQTGKRRYVPPYSVAMLHVGLDEKAQALVWLDRAYQDRSLRPVWLKFDPRLNGLRKSGELAGLVRRVGLTP